MSSEKIATQYFSDEVSDVVQLLDMRLEKITAKNIIEVAKILNQENVNRRSSNNVSYVSHHARLKP